MTTVAPTGTISLLAGCSSGIEPVFSFAYTRKNTVGKTFVIVNPVFRDALDRILAEMGLAEDERAKRAEEVVSHVHETGTVQDLAWLPEGFRRLFKTALDVSWQDHVRMQASFQRHVHASISKTVNMPCSATKEDCAEALLMAWRLGLKGITIYRTGSRESVVLALKETEALPPAPVGKTRPEQVPRLPLDRPKELAGRTYLCQSGCCRLYVTVNLLEGQADRGLHPDGRAGRMRGEQQRDGTGDQHRAPERRAVPEVRPAVRKGQLHLRDQEPGVGGALVRGRRRPLHRPLGEEREHHDPAGLGDPAGGLEQSRRLCPDCREPLDFGEGCNQGICKHCGWSGCS